MRAAIIAVGTELLGTERLDTNSLRLTGIFRRHGVELARKSVIGDREEELHRELELVLGRYDLVVTSGGLGPTRDDLTREVVAAACGRALHLDESVLADIEAKFRSFGRAMPPVNRRQALVIEGSEVLANRKGTAPGLRIEHRGTTLFLLPGVPWELDHLAAAYLEPWLAERSGDVQQESCTLKVAMLPESEVEERLAPLYDEIDRQRISVLASPGEIRVEVTAEGDEPTRRRELERLTARVRTLIGPAVFTDDPAHDLADVVGRLLAERGETVATAESCTGGMVAERITAVPGSSAYFLGSLVVYSDAAKQALAGVSAADLAAHGAVSEPVARALARGARSALASDHGIGITGVAGPSGGSEAKPVGLVHLALAGPAGETHLRVVFPGDRERVRRYSSQLALEMLRRALLGIPRRE
jgi:nicotinamide-nucleotide amidase